MSENGTDNVILDAEAENLTHNQTAEKILSIEPVLAIFMIYGQQPSASTQCMPGGKKTCEHNEWGRKSYFITEKSWKISEWNIRKRVLHFAYKILICAYDKR